MFAIQVDCYAGYRGEETPRMIHFKQRIIRIEKVMDRWLSPDHRYFKVRGDDAAVYIIRHDINRMQWELTFYRKCRKPENGAESEEF